MRLGSEWERLHPLSPFLRAGRVAVVAIALLADDAVELLDLGAGPALLVLFALVVVALGVGWWAWKTTGYQVTAEEVELRTGMFFRRHRRVPISRLESIDLARPFFARIFGLVQLRLEAVSQGTSEVRLSYLDEQTALGLRDRLRSARDGPVTAGAAAPTEPSEVSVPDQPIVQVPTRELVLAYVVARVAGVWPVLLVVFLIVLAVGGLGPAAAFGFGAAPLAAAAVISGIVEVERLYGFVLSESGRGFEIRRGLLNQLQQVVPLDRVQAVALVEPPFWRPFGRAKLVVDVAGYRGANQQDGNQSSVLLPIATLEVAHAVLGRVLPAFRLDGAPQVGVPASARWRAPVRWRTYTVAWNDRHAVVRGGLLQRETDIVPHVKVQSLRVTQGPWQRRLGLSTLHLDTAGTRVKVRARHRASDDAERLAWASRSRAAAAGAGAT